MYKISEQSVKNLENAFNLLNQIETKGINNHVTISNIASLLQEIRADMTEIDNKVKTSNLPIKKEKEEK